MKALTPTACVQDAETCRGFMAHAQGMPRTSQMLPPLDMLIKAASQYFSNVLTGTEWEQMGEACFQSSDPYR